MRTIYLFFSFFILSIFSVFGSIVDVEKTHIRITSPDSLIHFHFYQRMDSDEQYHLYYSISYKDKVTIKESRMGLELDNKVWEMALAEDIQRKDRWYYDLIFRTVEYKNCRNNWKPLYGERGLITDNWNGALLKFEKSNNSGYSMDIEIRVYNEGVAFRYLFPEHPNAIYHKVIADDTEYTFEKGAQTWCASWAQGIYKQLSIPEWKGIYERPMTIGLPNGLWVSIADADVADWCLSRFKKNIQKQNTISTDMYDVVDVVTPGKTPWKAILIAETPGKLLDNNDMILNLNQDCTLDFSWVKPGKILREITLTTENAIECIDFCVEHNLQYILFDGGWYGHATTFRADASYVSVPIDLAKVIAYGKERGIGVWLYVNQHALQKHAKTLFPLYRKWGIVGLKFGFVQYATHRWSVWMHDLVKLAAENQLMVNIHDEYRPSGFSRTYPNLLTQEGIRGNEEFPDATHNTILPFTRLISGAADYTICYYDKRLKTTHAHQLAASVIFYSPLQTLFWYDKPSFYNNEPEITFFENLPTVFDDSTVLLGEPGKQVFMARRKKDDWFVGGITNNNGSNEIITLNFLEPDKTYLAIVYTDDENERISTHVKCSSFLTDSSQQMKFKLKPSGGVAIHFVPVMRGERIKYKKYKGQWL